MNENVRSLRFRSASMRTGAFAAGATSGAAVAYLLDPEVEARRRRLPDRGVALARRPLERLARMSQGGAFERCIRSLEPVRTVENLLHLPGGTAAAGRQQEVV